MMRHYRIKWIRRRNLQDNGVYPDVYPSYDDARQVIAVLKSGESGDHYVFYPVPIKQENEQWWTRHLN